MSWPCLHLERKNILTAAEEGLGNTRPLDILFGSLNVTNRHATTEYYYISGPPPLSAKWAIRSKHLVLMRRGGGGCQIRTIISASVTIVPWQSEFLHQNLATPTATSSHHRVAPSFSFWRRLGNFVVRDGRRGDEAKFFFLQSRRARDRHFSFPPSFLLLVKRQERSGELFLLLLFPTWQMAARLHSTFLCVAASSSFTFFFASGKLLPFHPPSLPLPLSCPPPFRP